MTFTDDTTYLLGDDILVAPLLSNASNSRSVTFPGEGSWSNWFTNETYSGGSTATVCAALDQYPVFKKAGSIIALRGALAHHASSFDRSLDPRGPPSLVLDITQPVAAGMACVRRGSNSNGTGFIAEYFHDYEGTTLLSARGRGLQSVAFVMVIRHAFLLIAPTPSFNLCFCPSLNIALQSPVPRPSRVYLSPQQPASHIGPGVLWSHVGNALTVVLADTVEDVRVDWVQDSFLSQ